MKKAISTSFYGEGNPNNSVSYMGCLETFKWKAVSYDGGPKKSGRYLTTDGRGNAQKIHFAVGQDLLQLFGNVAHGDFRNVLVCENDGTGRFATDKELMKVARSYCMWYDYYDENDRSTIFFFLDEDTIPKYYLDVDLDDPNLKFGPIDEELDTYEAEETDFETW